MRLFAVRPSLAIAAAIAAVPAVSALAQAPVERPATHTVRKGDTLWDLAKLYLGDAYQWPQIYRLNTEKIKDPHWIYPGQVFRIPGGTMGTEPAGPRPTTAAAPARRGNMTVFNPAFAQGEELKRQSVKIGERRTAVRPGDYESAPYMWALGGPADGGKIEASAEENVIGMTASLRPIQYREEVFVMLPRGVEARVGTRMLVYRMGDVVPGQGQVVVPTGIVRIMQLLDGGRARADIVQKYEDVFPTHRVTALDTLAMPEHVFPVRVEFGIATHVAWIYANPLLPAGGHRVILSATQANGLVAGDQLTLRREGTVAGSPDEELGVAQVTRVTPWGVSAILLEGRDAGIAVGMRATVSAKMP
jgi:hypothetical protein